MTKSPQGECPTGDYEQAEAVAPKGSRSESPAPPRCQKHNAPLDVDTDCHVCHGEGMIEADDYGLTHAETCWQCKGSGMGWPDCEFCIEESYDDYA